MIIEEFLDIAPVNGVLTISDVDESFEKTYLQIRKKEKRIYRDEELRLLPFASRLNPHKEEWNQRAKSFLRFKKYLSKKKSGLNILDLGCGTCWFASQILRESDHNFYCVDVNLTELRRGAKLFSSEKIKFIYADIFQVKFPRSSFDMIILNSSIQYFPDVRILMRELFYLLNSYGEIHIIDTPFYEDDEVEFARNKTLQYYDSIGFPKMKEKYFHHTFRSIKDFNHYYLYDPRGLTNKIQSIAFGKDSPFPWIMINR